MASGSHELMHWTGHPKRLDWAKGKKFGNPTYAAEELIAELGAAFYDIFFIPSNDIIVKKLF